MPVVAINGSASPSNPNAFSGWNPIYCQAAVPLARVAHNGARYAVFTALHLYGGSGGTIGIYMANGDGGDYQSSGGFGSVASGSWDTGWRGLSKGFAGIAPGWEMRVGFTFSGTLYYGRHGAGGNIYGGAGVEWTGASLSGEASYIEVPAEPVITNIERLSNGNTRVHFVGPGDNGGSALTEYTMQYSQDPGFGSGVTQFNLIVSPVDLNLPPGPWYFRVAALNAMASYYGVHSQWSGVQSFTVAARGRRWNGTSWTPITTAKRWNGTSWVNLATMKRWTGSAWVDLNA